jgi:hypothetical protein
MKAELRVVEWQNEIMVESPFSQLCGTPPPSEKSQQLRERHKLDDVIAGSTSDFDSMLRLKEWVHTRWRHGWHHPAGPVDAMLALAAAEEGFDMNCGYFALTLLECLQALGFVARSANASKTATEWKDDVEGNTGHSIIEVWSDDLCKWVMLDADLNVHYESEDGVPLSVLGIHDEWMAGPAAWDKVKQVQGATPYCMTDLGGKSMPSPDFYGEDFVFDPEAEPSPCRGLFRTLQLGTRRWPQAQLGRLTHATEADGFVAACTRSASLCGSGAGRRRRYCLGVEPRPG